MDARADIQAGGTPTGTGLNTLSEEARRTRCVLCDRDVSGQRTAHIMSAQTLVYEFMNMNTGERPTQREKQKGK